MARSSCTKLHYRSIAYRVHRALLSKDTNNNIIRESIYRSRWLISSSRFYRHGCFVLFSFCFFFFVHYIIALFLGWRDLHALSKSKEAMAQWIQTKPFVKLTRVNGMRLRLVIRLSLNRWTVGRCHSHRHRDCLCQCATPRLHCRYLYQCVTTTSLATAFQPRPLSPDWWPDYRHLPDSQRR